MLSQDHPYTCTPYDVIGGLRACHTSHILSASIFYYKPLQERYCYFIVDLRSLMHTSPAPL